MTHHRRGLRRLLRDDDLLARIERDWRTAGLDARRRAILGYAEALTRTPSAVAEEDVEGLRAAGLDDADVLGLAECVAYYAYVNRIADGLGVRLEGESAPESGESGAVGDAGGRDSGNGGRADG
ncbi:MAG: hypothetical protein AAF957_14105 [Planctomycetota bacterium]